MGMSPAERQRAYRARQRAKNPTIPRLRRDLTGQQFGKWSVDSRAEGKYWNCTCECGLSTKVYGSNLLRGLSGGCRKCTNPHLLPVGQAALNRLFANYKKNAKKRGYSFELSLEQFRQLTSMECFYCGASPLKQYGITRGNGLYTYNGIDRVENSLGYVPGNCAPCCEPCNRAKLKMTQQEFLSLARRIAAKHPHSIQ